MGVVVMGVWNLLVPKKKCARSLYYTLLLNRVNKTITFFTFTLLSSNEVLVYLMFHLHMVILIYRLGNVHTSSF